MGLFFNDLRAQFRAKPEGGATLGQYIPEEVRRLESYLYDHEANKQRIIENVTDDLLTGYYETRTSLTKIKNDKKKRAAAAKAGAAAPSPEADGKNKKRAAKSAKAGAAAPSPEADEKELRAVMLTYHDVAAMVMVDICRRVGGSYSDEFIRRWEEKTSRTGYFPFGALMRTNARATPSPTDNAQPEQPEASTNEYKGKTLPVHVRAAIVEKLLSIAGVTAKSISNPTGTHDKTTVCKFVNAVIGGNTDTKIRNSSTYRHIGRPLTTKEQKRMRDDCLALLNIPK